jgi:hypothetical protein
MIELAVLLEQAGEMMVLAFQLMNEIAVFGET